MSSLPGLVSPFWNPKFPPWSRWWVFSTYYAQSFFWPSGQDPTVLGNRNDCQENKETTSLLCPSFTSTNSCRIQLKWSPLLIATMHNNSSRTRPFAAAIATTSTKVLGSGHFEQTCSCVLPAGLRMAYLSLLKQLDVLLCPNIPAVCGKKGHTMSTENGPILPDVRPTCAIVDGLQVGLHTTLSWQSME